MFVLERLCIFQMTDKSVPGLSSALYLLYFSLFVPGLHWSKTPPSDISRREGRLTHGGSAS